MKTFLASMGWIFLFEMGDKTQLVALGLAARYSAGLTLAGILAATLVIHLFSIALGGCAGKLLPSDWIRFISAIAFIGFGLWTYRGDCLEDEAGAKCPTNRGAFWCVFTTFFIAELGDKTMLGTVALASTNSLIPVWLGSSLGMVMADGLAIIVGQVMGTRLPEKAVRIGAALIFLGCGIFGVISEGMHLPRIAWAIAGVSIAVLGYIFLRPAPAGTCLAELNIREEEEVVTPGKR